jgi:hypothetical protein
VGGGGGVCPLFVCEPGDKWSPNKNMHTSCWDWAVACACGKPTPSRLTSFSNTAWITGVDYLLLQAHTTGLSNYRSITTSSRANTICRYATRCALMCDVLSIRQSLMICNNTGWSLSTYYKMKTYGGSKTLSPRILNRSRDSVVGVATDFGLDNRGVRVRVPVGSRIFSSPCRPDRLCGPSNLLCSG